MTKESDHIEVIKNLAIISTKADGINHRLDVSNNRISKNEESIRILQQFDAVAGPWNETLKQTVTANTQAIASNTKIINDIKRTLAYYIGGATAIIGILQITLKLL